MPHYLIDDHQIETLRRAATRLHSEERLDGDAMRDIGHALEAIARVAADTPVPHSEVAFVLEMKGVVRGRVYRDWTPAVDGSVGDSTFSSEDEAARIAAGLGLLARDPVVGDVHAWRLRRVPAR